LYLLFGQKSEFEDISINDDRRDGLTHKFNQQGYRVFMVI